MLVYFLQTDKKNVVMESFDDQHHDGGEDIVAAAPSLDSAPVVLELAEGEKEECPQKDTAFEMEVRNLICRVLPVCTERTAQPPNAKFVRCG